VSPSILVASWKDGVVRIGDGAIHREIADRPVRALTSDGRGGVLAIVGGHSICRRSAGGKWDAIAESESELSCCVALGDVVFAGTEDASVLRLDPDGTLARLTGFDEVEGRDTWWDGRWGFVR
jgi:hypothetical protein